MSDAFVWFHNNSDKPQEAVRFYEALLGWSQAEGPPDMTLFAGEKGPFAAIGGGEEIRGWIPYAQVEDVDAATERAEKLGARVVKARTRGPAGHYTIVRDPGGAALALWQKA